MKHFLEHALPNLVQCTFPSAAALTEYVQPASEPLAQAADSNAAQAHTTTPQAQAQIYPLDAEPQAATAASCGQQGVGPKLSVVAGITEQTPAAQDREAPPEVNLYRALDGGAVAYTGDCNGSAQQAALCSEPAAALASQPSSAHTTLPTGRETTHAAQPVHAQALPNQEAATAEEAIVKSSGAMAMLAQMLDAVPAQAVTQVLPNQEAATAEEAVVESSGAMAMLAQLLEVVPAQAVMQMLAVRAGSSSCCSSGTPCIPVEATMQLLAELHSTELFKAVHQQLSHLAVTQPVTNSKHFGQIRPVDGSSNMQAQVTAGKCIGCGTSAYRTAETADQPSPDVCDAANSQPQLACTEPDNLCSQDCDSHAGFTETSKPYPLAEALCMLLLLVPASAWEDIPDLQVCPSCVARSAILMRLHAASCQGSDCLSHVKLSHHCFIANIVAA